MSGTVFIVLFSFEILCAEHCQPEWHNYFRYVCMYVCMPIYAYTCYIFVLGNYKTQ